ncbi:hypothetical protein BLNAU_9685 [Blattamonas nauphoetae]|uniref:Uncharacterized protein n=1 Tax=Blattamonas nauphoetae TaxID=2049346 RepID=A0ABQ9XUY5_9EUKA|nr:hypothetical protein BLNAU_9685 [Blattamonas nauphoetae]
MEMLEVQLNHCSAKFRISLVKADLIPQLVNTLNPLSLSFAEAVNIHINLMKTVQISFWLATPFGLNNLEIEEDSGQQAVHETVLQQVLVPSEKYIWHSCVNRYSIVDGDQSDDFLTLLARLLQICPSYQPSMDFVLCMPITLTIPGCLTFFEKDDSVYSFLYFMVVIQRTWNKTRGAVQNMWKKVHRMLRMEGIEDAIETKLQNDRNEFHGKQVVAHSIRWNNLLGMNLPEQE